MFNVPASERHSPKDRFLARPVVWPLSEDE